MSLLAVGPLPVKKKKEVVNGIPVLTVRCGVKDCPEILGRISQSHLIARLNLARGYDFSRRENVWIKSKRPANRMKHHRELVDLIVTSDAEESLRDLERDRDELIGAAFDDLPEGMTFGEFQKESLGVDLTEIERKESQIHARQTAAKRSKSDGFGAYIETLPIVVRCARCGRLSKITA